MSDSPRTISPLLRPVLTLRKEPVGTPAPPGGKKESDIVSSRLETQRQKLSADVQDIVSCQSSLNFFNDKILVKVRMFADSFAVSKSPKDLISAAGENLLTRPLDNGYLAEVSINNLNNIYRRMQSGGSVAIRCDISRIKSISPLGRKHVLRNRTVDSLWDQAIEIDGKKAFYIWLAPFKDQIARRELLSRLLEMQDRELLSSTYPVVSFGRGTSSDVVSRARNDRESSIPTLMRYYESEGKGRAVIRVSSRDALRSIIASGSPFRMEPLVGIGTTAPGEGAEPLPRLPATISQEPIVGIIDGGCAAQRYSAAEAWRERPLIQDGQSDRRHGNQVTSLVVHGHEWNNNLPLPQLFCRFGTAQAVPRSDVFPPPDPTGLPSYIESIVARHPETKVWNLSWNERTASDPIYVSALGHDLSIIARRYRILFVISAGNVENTDGDCIAPPADCEAALVVGGRQFDANGRPTDRCPSSLKGYGPDLRLVPHICSYSPLRLLGGVSERGTSFPTGIISSLAAHSFENLRDPTPDLVKALIIDQCDQNDYSPEIGWGTPSPSYLPWSCPPGTVKLVFRRSLNAGLRYYWEDIPIPAALRRGNKICGQVSLTTIHQPTCVDEGGPSYISTRVAAAIQHQDNGGKYTRLCGAKETEDTLEITARASEYKWQPTQRVVRDFTKRGGILNSGNNFRLYARLFARNMNHQGFNTNAEIPPVETVFVVTISDGTKNYGVYDSMVSALGNNVESAVLEQNLDIDV